MNRRDFVIQFVLNRARATPNGAPWYRRDVVVEAIETFDNIMKMA